MINEEHHIALPKLYGAPAYARPPRPTAEATPRPPDPDDLPLEAFRADGDSFDGNGHHEVAAGSGNGSGNGHARGNGHGAPTGGGPRLQPRPFSLRSLSRFISGR